jgi:glycosyltransferase involved in cell wall biosynthesis
VAKTKRAGNATKRKPTLSIVIPAYNEEKYLPKLLDSIQAQDFRDYEIIVVIKPSNDKTLAVASKYDCVINAGGGLPSVSRNIGAKMANADIILFADSDTVLPQGFLTELLLKYNSRKLACASCFSRVNSKKLLNKAFFNVLDIFYWLVQKISPMASGYCIIISKGLFVKIGGFDESLKTFEDFDLVKRASRYGKFSFLSSPKIIVSARRIEKEGLFGYSLKCLWASMLYGMFGKHKVQRMRTYTYGKF